MAYTTLPIMVAKRHSHATKIIAGLTTILMLMPVISGCITDNNNHNNNGNNYDPNADNDGDGIINYIEKNKDLDINNTHSFGNLDDFVRIYGFTEEIPKNMSYEDLENNLSSFTPKNWKNLDGEVDMKQERLIEITLNNPLFQYYDKNKINIQWINDSKYGKIGLFKFGNEPLILPGQKEVNIPINPVSLLYGERKGSCGEAASLFSAVFENRNILNIGVNVLTSTSAKHGVVECLIDGKVYVANNNNKIIERGEKGNSIYDEYNWTRRISPEWDWYLEYI